MQRYLALFWNPLDLESVHAFQELKSSMAAHAAGWVRAFEAPGAWVIQTGLGADSTQTYLLKGGSGVVLGRIFRGCKGKYAAAANVVFDTDETREIVSSAGQHLIDRYWGRYLAVIHDHSHSRHHVFRDPIGNVPGYRTRAKGVDVIFSDIEDCVRLLPVSFSVKRHYLSRWLIYGALTSLDTGLENVESMPPGERLTWSQGCVSRSLMWDPIEIARAAPLQQPGEAASALRETVQSTVDAWAGGYERIVHRLSGGFDSSVVAGCLDRAPSKPQVSYLNLALATQPGSEQTHRPGLDPKLAAKMRAIAGQGDERYFARLVAERYNTPLMERQRTLCMDLRRLWQAPLRVRPALYYTVMQTDDIAVELCKEEGIQAFWSGQAGDSVFLATQQPFSAIDYAYVHGLRPGLRHQLFATAQLSRESIWSVMGTTIRHGLLRRPYASPISILQQPTLVSDDITRTLSHKDFESDLAKRIAHARLPPGKQDHAKGVAWSAYYDFVFHAGQFADHIDPLNSQPVWELALQIPTWTLLAGGISRGLARRAFADLLPEEIRTRQIKGSGGLFYQQLVRRNRRLLQDTLLDGLLVKRGYLDRRRLDACLAADELLMEVSAVVILNYLSAEIWLQQWADHRQAATAHGASRLQEAAH